MASKFIPLAILSLILLVSPVFAWHCYDSDAAVPLKNASGRYGVWGNDSLIGGVNQGWVESFTSEKDLPYGCYGNSNGNIECADSCLNSTFREFYCGDRQSTGGESVIFYSDHPKNAQCDIPNVPEYGNFGILIVLVLSVTFIFVLRNKSN